MAINHFELLWTPQAAPYIAQAGGKLGSLAYLRAAVPSLREAILPLQVIGPDDPVSKITVPPGDDGRYIVRGSHPIDFQGLVDVLGTQTASNPREVADAVYNIRRDARSPQVMAFGQYEHPAYFGRIFTGIQPYLDCQRGNIVDHPNMPGNYLISVADTDYTPIFYKANTVLYSPEDPKRDFLSGDPGEIQGDADRVLRRVTEIHQTIAESGLAKDGFSLQTEFLNQNGNIYATQVRVFKEKQAADFELDTPSRLVFGTTPKEGITVPVFASPNGFDRDGNPINMHEPWAFLRSLHIEPLSLRFQPSNLAAYLISQSFHSGVNVSLEHNHFRMAQKAGVTIFEGGILNRHDFTRLFKGESHKRMAKLAWENDVENLALLSDTADIFAERDLLTSFQVRLLGTKAKIISDGRTAVVEPVLAG